MSDLAAILRRYAGDRVAFRHECRILDDGRRYGEVCEEWQEERVFGPVVAGKHCYLQLPRGHDKTGSIAWCCIDWLLFGRDEEDIVVVAGDVDQARLDLEEVERQIARVPWVKKLLRVDRNKVRCPTRRSKLTVISSDAGSSYGLKPTRVVIEELHGWTGGKALELFESLWGSIAKREAQVVVLTNAGAGRDWKWDKREVFRVAAEEDPGRWHFWAPSGWQAGFADPELLAKGLTPLSRARFIENRWLAEAENSFLTSAQVEAGLCRYEPPALSEEFTLRALGIDLGLTHDAAVVSCVGLSGEGEYALLSMDVFVGSKEEPVDLVAVGQVALDRVGEWDPLATVLDPWQGMQMHQQLGGQLLSEVFHFGASSVKALTEISWQVMSSGSFRFWPGAGFALQRGEPWDLEREMRSAILKVMPYGERLDHQSGGYSDRLVSVCLALWRLSQEVVAEDGVQLW